MSDEAAPDDGKQQTKVPAPGPGLAGIVQWMLDVEDRYYRAAPARQYSDPVMVLKIALTGVRLLAGRADEILSGAARRLAAAEASYTAIEGRVAALEAQIRAADAATDAALRQLLASGLPPETMAEIEAQMPPEVRARLAALRPAAPAALPDAPVTAALPPAADTAEEVGAAVAAVAPVVPIKPGKKKAGDAADSGKGGAA